MNAAPDFLSHIAEISTGWSLAAFAIAAVLALLTRPRGKPLVIAGLVAIVVLGALPILADLYMRRIDVAQVYHLRAVVVGPANTPVDGAKVWSTVGGEPKTVAGGWEFTIPVSTAPRDHKMTVYAEQADAFLHGSTELNLGDDLNPTVTVRLARDAAARVRGMVIDRGGHAVANAQVSILGFGQEAVTKPTPPAASICRRMRPNPSRSSSTPSPSATAPSPSGRPPARKA